MHTDQTLDIFDKETVLIGAEFQAFASKTCPVFETKELARETAARHRRQQKKAQDKGSRPAPLTSDSNRQSLQETQKGDNVPIPLASDSNGLGQPPQTQKGDNVPTQVTSDSDGQSQWMAPNKDNIPPQEQTQQTASQPRLKKFSLLSYKYHSLSDYPDTIHRFGTTDSYSTEPVSNSCSLNACVKTWSRVS